MARRITASNRNGTEQSAMTDLTVAQAVALLRPVESNNFAQSLIRDYDRYRGDIGGNKSAWLMVLGQQLLDRKNQPERPSTTLTADFAGLTAIFRTAIASGKKYPKIALRTAGGLPLVLSLAGERSRYAGAVNVTDGGKYPDNVYYGRIEPSGAFAGRDPGPDVLDLLQQFAADPQGVAAAYGHLTGECAFCQAALTDERSVLQGYGPICAQRVGLSWGERPAKQVPAPVLAEQQQDLAFAVAERAQEQAGFASDPDYSGFRQTELTFDGLLERAAVVATRDGYLQPRAERLVGAATADDSPWRDDD